MCSSSALSTHCLPILFFRIFSWVPCYFSLLTPLLIRGGQSRPDASAGAVLLCCPPAPHSSPAFLWVLYSDLNAMPTDVTEWIYKAEEDGVSFLPASFSDCAELNISPENMLVLSTQGVQNPWEFTAPGALPFSRPS